MPKKSPRAAVRAVRLVRIPMLLAQGPRRAVDLAEELGVSQRSISRDLQLLQGPPFHLPITMGDSWLWYIGSPKEQAKGAGELGRLLQG